MAEKTFVLFEDDGDEAKIVELAEFMGDIEWEGDGCGISITLRARVGDTIVISDYGEVSVRRAGAPAPENLQDGSSMHAALLGGRR
jgi:hypothetical protein